MTGKGDLSSFSGRTLRRLVWIQGVWLALVCCLGVWWGILILRLAGRVYELETKLGTPEGTAVENWHHLRKIIIWESTAFFVFLSALLVFIFWTHWREMKRTRSLQGFFASLTHELRTPLTSIRLQAEALLDRMGAPKEETLPLFSRLLQDVSRLEGQVNRTLELARLEGGGTLLVEPVEVSRFLLGFFTRDSVLPASFQVELPKTDREIWIDADPSALEVSFRNIIENAQRHGASPLRISIEESNTSITISVLDQGKGAEGDIEKLGNLFEKSASSRGAGVGLYLIRSLQEKMGGKAIFQNETPRGFRVSLVFPR